MGEILLDRLYEVLGEAQHFQRFFLRGSAEIPVITGLTPLKGAVQGFAHRFGEAPGFDKDAVKQRDGLTMTRGRKPFMGQQGQHSVKHGVIRPVHNAGGGSTAFGQKPDIAQGVCCPFQTVPYQACSVPLPLGSHIGIPSCHTLDTRSNNSGCSHSSWVMGMSESTRLCRNPTSQATSHTVLTRSRRHWGRMTAISTSEPSVAVPRAQEPKSYRGGRKPNRAWSSSASSFKSSFNSAGKGFTPWASIGASCPEVSRSAISL